MPASDDMSVLFRLKRVLFSKTQQHSAASMGSEAVDSPASCGSDAATDLLEGGDPTPRPTSRTLGLEEPSFVAAQRVAAEAGDLPGQKPQPEALRPAEPLPEVDREAVLVPSVDPAEAEEAALLPPLASSAEKARSSLLSYYAQTGVRCQCLLCLWLGSVGVGDR